MIVRTTTTTVANLAAELRRRGDILNLFGPSGDGDAMLAAADTLTTMRWLVAELADFVTGLGDALDMVGALDEDTRLVLSDLTGNARGAVL